ncbi:MAG: diguanylate cyclase [Desulfobacterales bacterium]|nr:diguanylate cyclase [Desulfobacterales bacterium]
MAKTGIKCFYGVLRMIFSQIFDMINSGIVILDRDLKVVKWNRWMENYSKIPANDVIGKSIIEFYPNLDNAKFKRNVKSVLAFGNFSFFSQKLHKYIFPFKALNTLGVKFDYMQQNCTMGPIRGENNSIEYIYIMVQDVTEVAAYEQKLIEMNIKDGLTGAYNRRYFETRIKEEFARHKRYSRPFSIIMQDIDYFKKVNDTYGHQAGDFILTSFSSSVAGRIRNVDILARYGGEEFCCLLPETNLKSAKLVAEHVRHLVEQSIYKFKNLELKITVSQGVAELNPEMSSHEIMLKRADDALYEAKKTGRNKVIGWEEKNQNT